KLAAFMHSDGADVPKEVILSFVKNPNFKDWLNEVDAIERLFSCYLSIKRLGGPNKIVKDNADIINALIKNKIIKRGISVRLKSIVKIFEEGVRINPNIEGFDKIK